MKRFRLLLLVIILEEIYLLILLFSGELSEEGKTALVINAILIAIFSGFISELYNFLLDKSISTGREKEEKKLRVKREDGTLAGEELVMVQNLKAPLDERVLNLIWLTRSVMRSNATNKKKKLLKSIAQYNDEYGKPMNEAALLRFIEFYGNDFLKNEGLNEYSKQELQLLMFGVFFAELQARNRK